MSERMAKTFFLWIAFHIAAYGLMFCQGHDGIPALLAVFVLIAYFSCILRIDWLLWTEKSLESILTMSRYWLAAAICMTLWVFYGNPQLSGSGGAVEALLLGLAVPYGPLLSCDLYQVYTPHIKTASQISLYIELAFCIGHWIYYSRLKGSLKAK